MASVATPPPLTALVLGVGGNVSQGILKALAASDLRLRVVGACTSPLSAGLYLTDRAYVSPAAADPDFLDWLLEVCKRERVGAILSGVEPVLEVLSRHAGTIRDSVGAVSVVAPPDRLEVAADKLRTTRWLGERGFPAPRSADASDSEAVEALVADCGLPLLAKPRFGKSGQGVIEVDDPATLAYAQSRPGYVLQERLGGYELTVACLCDREGGVRGAFAMRRELKEGTTYRAEAGEFPGARHAAIRIAAELAAPGPVNVQMREPDGEPICFEVNLRFSGTAPIRARLGFNDVEAAVRHLVLGEPATDLPLITEGLVLRYWDEIYVDPAASEELARNRTLDDPRSAAARPDSDAKH